MTLLHNKKSQHCWLTCNVQWIPDNIDVSLASAVFTSSAVIGSIVTMILKEKAFLREKGEKEGTSKGLTMGDFLTRERLRTLHAVAVA